MAELGRTLLLLGALVALAGLALIFWDRIGLPRLAGDIVFRRGGTTIYFPIITSIVVSLILTLLLNLFFRRK